MFAQIIPLLYVNKLILFKSPEWIHAIENFCLIEYIIVDSIITHEFWFSDFVNWIEIIVRIHFAKYLQSINYKPTISFLNFSNFYL